jgi:signal transduction histidine kinase
MAGDGHALGRSAEELVRGADGLHVLDEGCATGDTTRFLARIADEQAVPRRVATLVASGAESEAVLASVAEEVAALFDADIATIVQLGPDGEVTRTASHGLKSPSRGTRFKLSPQFAAVTAVWQTGRAVRFDEDDLASLDLPETIRAEGSRSSVNAAILVEGRIWGVIGVGSRRGPLPPGTEERLVGFTELTAIAVASAQARSELRDFAAEQAALRRVATLVAREAPPPEVFAAVTAEAGRLLDADMTGISRYDPDGTHTLVAAWARTGAAALVPVGTRFGPGECDTQSLVFRTGRPARIDDYGQAAGPAAERARERGARAAVGAPVTVAGLLWGVVTVASRRAPLPDGTEARLARFTDLAATAIANAEAQAALTASRARVVTAADAARRQIEHDLRDAGQRRLASLARQLRDARTAVPARAGELPRLLDIVIAEADEALEELREIARGLHPSALTDGGLRPALEALARRSAVPVRLDLRLDAPLPESAELTAYYAVSEALANTAKHARASAAEVEVTAGHGTLRVYIRDDGRGGADTSRGSGLTGLQDRAEAIGGRLRLRSPLGEGTAVEITLPL